MAIARRLQLAGLMAIQVVVVWQIVGLAYHEVSLSKPVWIQGPSNVVSLTKTSSDSYQMLCTWPFFAFFLSNLSIRALIRLFVPLNSLSHHHL